MPKRRLTAIRLDKIAAVDRPCQAHAIAMITKRASGGPQEIAKATFQEALDAQLVSERVQRAFYGCFDNLWSRNDAFRTAMTDEIEAGGDGSVAAEAWVESVKALAEAAVEAAKANGGKPTDAELSGAMDDAVAKYLTSKEPTMPFTTKAALGEAITKFDPAKATIAHRDDILASAKSLGAEELLPMAGPLAKTAPVNDETVALKRQVAVLSMTPVHKAHFDTLDETGQTAFIAKSDADRTTEVNSKNAADPVVYKCADGTEIRKSDGAAAALLAKRLDGVVGELSVVKASAGAASIAKRAAEFSHLPNAEAIIKAHDAMPEADRAGYLETMRAANKAAGGVFKRMGVTSGGGLDVAKGADTPLGRMDAIVKRVMEADPKLNVFTATAKAASDPEYQEAYRESIADQLPASAQ